jgi:CBS domain-containing protein
MARTVEELMHEDVQTVRPDDTVKHAAVVMEACEIGPLPVCDGKRLVGIVTDRDITVRAVAAGRDPNTTSVREVMTAEALATCRPEQSVDDAVALMRRHEVRRLPVLDKDNRLVGMVALADLAQHTDERTSGKAVQGVSQPTETQQT